LASTLALALHFERQVASLLHPTRHVMMSLQPLTDLQAMAWLGHLLSAHDKHACTLTPPPVVDELPPAPVLPKSTQTPLRQARPSSQVLLP
jgi:hypothetical protein